MRTHRSILFILMCALGLGVVACGSSGGGTAATSAPPTTTAPATTAPATTAPATTPATSGGNAADVKAIKANWTTFFNAKTPTAQRVSLLQNGQALAQAIKAQEGGMAASASARVKTVTMTSPTQATVVYDILLGGSPALSGQKGVAVKQGGTWKVGLASFCGLLRLEAQVSNSTVPSACKSAG
jgi:phosphate-selective porin